MDVISTAKEVSEEFQAPLSVTRDFRLASSRERSSRSRFEGGGRTAPVGGHLDVTFATKRRNVNVIKRIMFRNLRSCRELKRREEMFDEVGMSSLEISFSLYPQHSGN